MPETVPIAEAIPVLAAEAVPPAAIPIPAPVALVRRIPHMGDALLMAALLLGGLFCTVILTMVALAWRLGGVSSPEKAMSSPLYVLGTMFVLYGVAFAAGVPVFQALWGRSVLAGLQWNAASAGRNWWKLMAAGVACFGVTVGLSSLLHFPTHTPMTDLLKSPGAMWWLFAFSITVAPLAEETICRGFLLPAFCTAWDWTGEKITHRAPQPLGPHGHPQWSLAAMIFGSALTSCIFAMGHTFQNGNALGPLVVIATVSVVLCVARLAARSVAASVITHATYNFSIFLVTLIRTHGFHHL